MRTLDEEIARQLQQAADAGELALAKAYGKPLAEDAGWEATPESLRMPMKILKDSGFVPPEVVWFHERARLRALLDAESDADAHLEFRRQLNELEQKIALRLESLRSHASL